MQYDLLIQNISSRSDTRHIDLQKALENNKTEFTFYPPFWRLFSLKLSKLNVVFNWKKLEYSSNDNPKVPPKTPGIYLFVLESNPIVFECYKYVMYVGMTDDGLIERLNTGYRTPSAVKNRPNIHRLILDYGNFLTWYYLPLPNFGKSQLLDIESNLIGYFCDPPINKKDAPFVVKQANKSKMS
tara:strand:+ start:531 stop:1082 length:552 start_codon:yes stop_codon:yes gene_type:complete